MHCPACGHENANPAAAFCGACGTALSPAARTPTPQAPAGAGSQLSDSDQPGVALRRPAAQHHAPWLIGAIAVVAILAIGVGGARLTHRSIFRHSAGTSLVAPAGSATNPDSQPPPAAASSAATPNADLAAPAGPPPPPFLSVHPTVTAATKAPVGPEHRRLELWRRDPECQRILWRTRPDGRRPDRRHRRAHLAARHCSGLPQDIIFAFYKKDTALVSAVAITYALESGKGPGAVEIWTTTDTTPTGFKQVAAARLADSVPLQAISFAPVEARYVKVRIDSGATDQLYMSQIRIVEGSQPGYTSLLERHPDILTWGSSVRHAAQRGIDWLEPAAMQWQYKNKCYGCHVQAQTMMGLAVAQQNNYLVSAVTLNALANFTRGEQNADGHEEDHGQGNQLTPTHFAAMGWSYYDDMNGIKTDSTLLRYVDWMLSHVDSTGEFEQDFTEAPIAQGEINATSNAVLGFMEAYTQTGNAKYKAAADKSLAFLAPDTMATTQDEVFKIIALERYGTPAQRQIATNTVRRIQHGSIGMAVGRRQHHREGIRSICDGTGPLRLQGSRREHPVDVLQQGRPLSRRQPGHGWLLGRQRQPAPVRLCSHDVGGDRPGGDCRAAIDGFIEGGPGPLRTGRALHQLRFQQSDATSGRPANHRTGPRPAAEVSRPSPHDQRPHRQRRHA